MPENKRQCRRRRDHERRWTNSRCIAKPKIDGSFLSQETHST
jgi:hypothetical protein